MPVTPVFPYTVPARMVLPEMAPEMVAEAAVRPLVSVAAVALRLPEAFTSPTTVATLGASVRAGVLRAVCRVSGLPITENDIQWARAKAEELGGSGWRRGGGGWVESVAHWYGSIEGEDRDDRGAGDRAAGSRRTRGRRQHVQDLHDDSGRRHDSAGNDHSRARGRCGCGLGLGGRHGQYHGPAGTRTRDDDRARDEHRRVHLGDVRLRRARQRPGQLGGGGRPVHDDRGHAEVVPDRGRVGVRRVDLLGEVGDRDPDRGAHRG